MGTFSIWHWLIVLIVFLAPVIGVLTAGKVGELGRGAYALRIVILILLGTVLALVLPILVEDGSREAAFAGLGALAYNSTAVFLCGRWSVHRLRNAGWNTWWALLVVVPLANIVAVIAWCFIVGRPKEASA